MCTMQACGALRSKVPHNAYAEAAKSDVADGPMTFDLPGRSPAAQIFSKQVSGVPPSQEYSGDP